MTTKLKSIINSNSNLHANTTMNTNWYRKKKKLSPFLLYHRSYQFLFCEIKTFCCLRVWECYQVAQVSTYTRTWNDQFRGDSCLTKEEQMRITRRPSDSTKRNLQIEGVTLFTWVVSFCNLFSNVYIMRCLKSLRSKLFFH